jgi:hypothetical protein
MRRLLLIAALLCSPEAFGYGPLAWAPDVDHLTPEAGDWTMSVGGLVARAKVQIERAGSTTWGTGGGGYIEGNYFATKALALNGEIVIAEHNEKFSLGGATVSASLTEFAVDVGVKLYPFQLGDAGWGQRQPYLRIGIGGAAYDVSAPVAVSVDPSFLLVLGAGIDLIPNPRWAFNFEADYFDTLFWSSASAPGFAFNYREYGFLGRVGLRYRF